MRELENESDFELLTAAQWSDSSEMITSSNVPALIYLISVK